MLQQCSGAVLLVGSTLLLGGCGGSSPSAGDIGFKGRIIDENSGQPISGAKVSLDGVEAFAPTNGNGDYVLQRPADEGCRLLTVNAPGFAPFTSDVSVVGDEMQTCSGNASRKMLGRRGGVNLNPLPNPATLLVGTMGDVRRALPGSCDSNEAVLPIQGLTSLLPRSEFVNDVAIVIDTSGSTSKLTNADLDEDGQNDTVLEAEVNAARELATSLQRNGARVGIVKFARRFARNSPDGDVSDGDEVTAQSRVVQEMTTKRNKVRKALDTVASEGSTGGTHSGAAIEQGVDVLLDAGDRRLSAVQQLTPKRSIIFLTDGIPTLPIEPGETQQRGDRLDTLAAASGAAAQGVAVHPVVIEPSGSGTRRLTTMPAVRALTGLAGDIVEVTVGGVNELTDALLGVQLLGVASVEAENVTLGKKRQIRTSPNGGFDGQVPVVLGLNKLKLRASPGNGRAGREVSLDVEVVAAGTEISPSVVVAGRRPVSQFNANDLVVETGLNINGRNLLDVLQDRAPDARVLRGIEDFSLLNGRVELDLLHREGGLNSDYGYFLYDPENPPGSADEVIAAATQENILFNSGSFANGSLSGPSIEVDIFNPLGLNVGLFVLPGHSLADAQAGNGPYPPLLSLSLLNPGGLVQIALLHDGADDSLLFAVDELPRLLSLNNRAFIDTLIRVRGLGIKLPRLRCG